MELVCGPAFVHIKQHKFGGFNFYTGFSLTIYYDRMGKNDKADRKCQLQSYLLSTISHPERCLCCHISTKCSWKQKYGKNTHIPGFLKQINNNNNNSSWNLSCDSESHNLQQLNLKTVTQAGAVTTLVLWSGSEVQRRRR